MQITTKQVHEVFSERANALVKKANLPIISERPVNAASLAAEKGWKTRRANAKKQN